MQNNWHKDRTTTPGYLTEEDAKKYGDRFDGTVRSYIPDPNKKRIVLTEEQEIYGMNGRPNGMAEGKRGIPKRKDAGTVRPNDEHRPLEMG